jgi:hypothetical protein
MNQINNSDPWYAPSGKKKPASAASVVLVSEQTPAALRIAFSFFSQLIRLRAIIFAALILAACVFAASRSFADGVFSVAGIGLILLGMILSFFIVFRFLGHELRAVLPLHATEAPLTVAFQWLRGQIRLDEGRRGPPAPELALAQFVSQVRAYASEKSFQNVKPLLDRSTADASGVPVESANLLRRRWNEVVDSLDEFEIYLANDPQGMIGKLVSKNPPKQLDAAVVFREVAESFDTTWRRKGINIESAIVTPLKATAQEGLLRRLLVGPWRASAYLARRGSSVVFSAKSVQGRVVARWEVDGLSIPDEYLSIANDSSLPVNERIEKGLTFLAPDPATSPNTLYALISLITWIDLAHACETEFDFKNNNTGFVIEIRLK